MTDFDKDELTKRSMQELLFHKRASRAKAYTANAAQLTNAQVEDDSRDFE